MELRHYAYRYVGTTSSHVVHPISTPYVNLEYGFQRTCISRIGCVKSNSTRGAASNEMLLDTANDDGNIYIGPISGQYKTFTGLNPACLSFYCSEKLSNQDFHNT